MVNEKVKNLMTAYLKDVLNSACVDNISVSANGNIEYPEECNKEKTASEVEIINPQNNEEGCEQCGDNKEEQQKEPCACDSKNMIPVCDTMKEAVGLLLASSETTFEEKREALLIMAICSEITAAYSYWFSYMSSVTCGKADFDPEFKQHCDEEWDHAKQFAERLRELGCCNPVPLFHEFTVCGPHKFIQESGNDSLTFLKNRDCEEQQAIEFYGVCVNFFKESDDSTTLQLFKRVKAVEEEHHKDLNDLIMQYENC